MNKGETDSVGRIAVVGGARTPFAKAGGELRSHDALSLAVRSVDGLLERLDVDPGHVDQLAFGNVVLDPRMPHLAREVVFASRLPAGVRALTLVDNCITGISAMSQVIAAIASGEARAGIAGGTESMSNPAVLFTRRASRLFVDLANARGFGARLAGLARLRPRHFWPDAPAIAEPSTGLSMGEHCEIMVKEWAIDREAQDRLALRSHRNAHAAAGRLEPEIVPVNGIRRDSLVRADTTLEQLAKLRPAFDRTPAGTITAGSSSPLTDGAASLLLVAEEHALRAGMEPLAFVKAIRYAAIDPDDGLLMGPALAVPRVLEDAGLELSDMDIVEMHEAFAGQVLCNLAAWERGWKERAIGAVDADRLNPLGSSIAIGHPFAATGVRIVTTLANELVRRGARYGLVSVCGAGATAAAVILERA